MFAKRTNWDLTLNPLAKAVAEHRAAGKPLMDLTESNPTACGFTYDTEAILSALHNPAAMVYEPSPKGLEVARQAVAGYYADRGDTVCIEDIFLTTSTSEAYSWALRLLCDPGDEVLIPSPGYPLLDFLADLNDVNLVRYPLFYVDSGFASTNPETRVDSGFASTNPETRDHGWHYDLHAIEQAITPRTRAIVVVHPNNPTGNYCQPLERERLNQICAERGLAVIADEVFLDYPLDGVPRASFVGNGNGENQSGAGSGNPRRPLTFTLSGISKICGLPQMKVAWVVVSGPEAPKNDALERLEVIADTYLSMNTPLQLALPELLATRHAFQVQVLERVRANLADLDRQVAGLPNWNRLIVEGGWCTVLSVPVGDTFERHEEVRTEAPLASGVLAHPGCLYGFARRERAVLSLLPSRALFTEAITRLIQS